jgi:hypothetical protein
VKNGEAGGTEPLTRLRGAGVDIDVRRAGRVAVAVVLVALAALSGVLFTAGVDKNAQITALRTRGVPVTVTVSGCLGLLGGSGSNAAGYACQGTFTFDRHRYHDDIPGNSFERPGSTVHAITDPDDPTLLSTAALVATQRASWTVFLLPGSLLILFVLIGGVALRRGRRSAHRERT